MLTVLVLMLVLITVSSVAGFGWFLRYVNKMDERLQLWIVNKWNKFIAKRMGQVSETLKL